MTLFSGTNDQLQLVTKPTALFCRWETNLLLCGTYLSLHYFQLHLNHSPALRANSPYSYTWKIIYVLDSQLTTIPQYEIIWPKPSHKQGTILFLHCFDTCRRHLLRRWWTHTLYMVLQTQCLSFSKGVLYTAGFIGSVSAPSYRVTINKTTIW